MKNSKKAKELLKQLDSLTKILSVDEHTIKQALIADFRDFEDGVQNFCAKEGGLALIVTRNIKDYTKSELAIHTPESYLRIFEEKLKDNK